MSLIVMCHNPITNDELQGEDVETRPRKLRFTLADLLTFVTAIPVCIGVIAAIEFTASNYSYEWFGNDWYSDVRYYLIKIIGVPSNFVCGYITFAMIDLPAWICYAAIALIFGLIRQKWSFTIGVAFILSIFVWDLISDYFSGFHAYINLRLVSLVGVVVTALCFAITRRIRGRSNIPDRRTGRIAMVFTCIAVVATLAVSIYGWWLVDLNRKSGLEIQEIFRDAMP